MPPLPHPPVYLAQAAGYFHRQLLSTVTKTYPIPGSWHPPEDNQSQIDPVCGVPWLTRGFPSSLAAPAIARQVQHLDIATQYCLQNSYSSTLHLSLFFFFSLIGKGERKTKQPKTTKSTISQCLEQVRVLCKAALRADPQLGRFPCTQQKASRWRVPFQWMGLKPEIPTLTHCGEGA